MSTNPGRWIIMAAALALSVGPALAQGTAFTYQGRLDNAGIAANGPHDFYFRLFDSSDGGVQVGPTLCSDNTSVEAGLFTLQLDFGQQFASTAQRHLDIAVRVDTGLTCGNTTGFVSLVPRLRLTATPLATHAIAAFALDAADGSPANAVFVNNVGDVGIGTIGPLGKLDVRAGNGSFVQVDSVHGDLHANGGTDGVFGLWNDSTAGFARTDFITAGVARLSVSINGNVGIGTTSPGQVLDVRGNIRMGYDGDRLAASGQENLRIVRGVVSASGSIIRGSGFIVTHPSYGRYSIVFDPPFSSAPAVTVTPDTNESALAMSMTEGVTAGVANILLANYVSEVNLPFHFIAIGSP